MMRAFKYLVFLMTGLLTVAQYHAQDCNGGAIATKESYRYGRYEVAMQSVNGSGIISSFFLYNIEVGCNWPAENNEIDIEMTGHTDSVHFTTHHPGGWYTGEAFDLDFNPHDTLQSYAIEWEPDIVRWFVDDQLIYVQDASYVQNLNYPMAILMNLYAAMSEAWAGPWDPTVMPLQSRYDYVRYFSYTPGIGSSGTSNNFTLEWTDDFDALDLDRWDISEFGGFGGNYCTFRQQNVEVDNGFLILTIDEPDPIVTTVPVTFTVNTDELTLEPTDQIFLNGTFNNWCGTCEPMAEENGRWSITIDLPPGKHEYLFTLNLWEENGGAPIGSECDFNPCDEFGNYGFVISEGDSNRVLKSWCWQACSDCIPLGIEKPNSSPSRTLLKTCDLLGREVIETPHEGQILIFIYDDGSTEKRFVMPSDRN